MKNFEDNQNNKEEGSENNNDLENKENNVEAEIDAELEKMENNLSNVHKEVEALGGIGATGKALEKCDEGKKAKLHKIVKNIAIGSGVVLFIAATNVDPSVIKDLRDFISQPVVEITTVAVISLLGLVGASVNTIRHKMRTKGVSVREATKEFFHPSSVNNVDNNGLI
jgi:hypothetical protein